MPPLRAVDPQLRIGVAWRSLSHLNHRNYWQLHGMSTSICIRKVNIWNWYPEIQIAIQVALTHNIDQAQSRAKDMEIVEPAHEED